MGYEFDDNGKYVSWSDLFDYSSIETLKASEYLPMPNKITYIKGSENAIDITKQIIDINNLEIKIQELQQLIPNTTDLVQLEKYTHDIDVYKAQIIRNYANILNKLFNVRSQLSKINEKVKPCKLVNWDSDLIPDDVANKVLAKLNQHENTYISPNNLQKCLKNSVSSLITNIIQNLRNMDQAYSPIAMGDLRNGADSSKKGAKSNRMTLMNPLTKFIMQESNMVGKGVIGIAAVGEKVFFNVSHYWNEGIRSGDPEYIANLQFHQIFDRIQGRYSKNITSVSRTKLTNVNFEDFEHMRERFVIINEIDNEIRQKYSITDFDVTNNTDKYKAYQSELQETIRNTQDSDVYADDLISQLLSAATDRP